MTVSTAKQTDKEYILVEKKENVATITLNRPNQLNSISDSLAHELEKTLCEVEGDKYVKAVILTGAGKHFSSGVDLRKASDYPTRLERSHQRFGEHTSNFY
ncbi:enoyl-CoA hydratase/isomerase family protein [Pseudalkalibacillus sp. A8]|uniref:enoyl-CoA hydratase/isomerase family protein n=1 Tax=Pseudalkalibacillus sp. A8 TaxID=3382641 RepID=UPI0038B41DC2